MLTLNTLLTTANISPRDVLAIRHTFVELHDDGNPGLSPHSTDEDILNYTATQSSGAQKFPRNPPRFWAVFIKDQSREARFHAIYENRGVHTDNGTLRYFNLHTTELLADYKDRLVIDWAAPIRWHVSGERASTYRILEIAQQRQLAFTGFYNFVLDYPTLEAVTTQTRYEQWHTAHASVKAICLSADATVATNEQGRIPLAALFCTRGAAPDLTYSQTDVQNLGFALTSRSQGFIC